MGPASEAPGMRSGRSVGAFRGRRGARPTTAGAGPGRRFGHRPRPLASSRQGRRITDLGPSFRSVFNRIPFSLSGLMVSSHCHLPRAEDGMRHPLTHRFSWGTRLLRPSFLPRRSPHGEVGYHYAAVWTLAAAGLAPAGRVLLWAATLLGQARTQRHG